MEHTASLRIQSLQIHTASLRIQSLQIHTASLRIQSLQIKTLVNDPVVTWSPVVTVTSLTTSGKFINDLWTRK